MIHQGCRFPDPGVSFTGWRVMPFLGAIDSALLLRFAHEDNTFVRSKSGPALVGDIVFALTFLEGDHRDIVVSDVAFNRFNKTAGGRLNHRRRGDPRSAGGVGGILK